MRTSLSVIIFFLLLTVAEFISAFNIIGTVVDETNTAVEFANVVLYQTVNDSLYNFALTDSNGIYSFQNITNGNYYLVFSFMAYQDDTIKNIIVDNQDIHLPQHQLTLLSNILDGVTITASKPIIERKADRIVYNVENSTATQSNNVLELLRYMPSVSVDANDNIKIYGKQGVQIMLNGKLQYVSGDALKNLLKSIQGDNVKTVEIISNAGAKYDASTKGGIINIELKKSYKTGLSGSVWANYQQGKYAKGGVGGNLSFSYKKIIFSVNYSPWFSKNYNYSDESRVYKLMDNAQIYNENSNEIYAYKGQFLSTSLDYMISDKHQIGVSTNLSYSNRNANTTNNTFIKTNNSVDSTIISITEGNYQLKYPMLNAYYTYNIDSIGKQLEINYSFANYNFTQQTLFNNRFVDANQIEYRPANTFNQRNPFINQLNAIAVDYTNPFKNKSSLELGTKYVNANQINDVEINNLVNNVYIVDTIQSNQYSYKEQIIAFYANWSTTIKDNMNIIIGCRTEQTIAVQDNKTINTSNKRNYFNVFPTFTIDYLLKDKHYFNWNINSKIERPNYRQLNAFIYYYSPNGVSTGNPNLKPAKTYTTEFNYVFDDIYSFIVGYQYYKDVIIDMTLQDDVNRKYIYTFQNYKYAQSLYFNFNIYKNLFKWWTFSFDLNAFYDKYNLFLVNQFEKKQSFSTDFSISNDFLLPKSFSINLSAWFSGPTYYGIDFYKSNGSVDFTITKKFFDDKLMVQLKAFDIFFTNKVKSIANYQNQEVNYLGYNDSRRLQIKLKYNFSNGLKINKEEKSNKMQEELNRVN
ncbi:MAG: outer membrane beta-barrel protein [Chitinophagales bacterium]|nr:outer membrane beta-barrel protein [Chitinophagales bacterium]